MPPVQRVVCADDLIEILDSRRVLRRLLKSDLPGTVNTIAKAETAANNWAATNFPDYQVRIHVFSLTPLRVTVICADHGYTIPDTWWGQ